MQIVILLTLLTLLPAIIMCITPFLRIAIVLHFLRQALGTQTAPSNQVLVGISLFLTMLVIQPVAVEMYHAGWEPLQNNEITTEQAFDAGSKPLKTFLVRFAREKDVKLFIDLSHAQAPHNVADLELRILIPAYILSGAEGRLSDWRCSVYAIPHHRSGGGFRNAVGRYGAATASHDLGRPSKFCCSFWPMAGIS